MGKGTPLTSTMVGRAVYELLEYGDAVSLRDVRLVLQSRTRVDLTSQKPLIKQMAEKLLCHTDFRSRLDADALEQIIARLRDPCIGKWEPFCNILATGAACVAVLRQHDRPCGNTCCQQERGRMLFQQLHDAPCLTDVWKGMWEPIPRNVLRTRSRNHPGDGFAWFSMTLVTRVLDCGDSRNQDEQRMSATLRPDTRLAKRRSRSAWPGARCPAFCHGSLLISM